MQPRQTRRTFLQTAGSAGLLTLGSRRLSAQEAARKESTVNRPNFLVIVADDLGWADVGYHGSKIRTPNLDRLVAEGVDLDQHYVCPMCTPTRVSLLAGRYCSRWGDQARKPSNERVLPFGTETLASALESVGYDTGLSGKWHLGSKPEWGPNHFGFSCSYGSLAGGVGPYDHHYKKGEFSRTWHRNEELVDEEGHVTDLIGREVVGWIREKREPWFYYVPFTAVHIPVQAPPEYQDQYAHLTFSEAPVKDEGAKRYAAYATQMDDWIGKLVQALEETGQRDNTLILFVSDNGAPRGPWIAANDKYPGTYPNAPVLGSNLPLRGFKSTMYEGGIRTPALLNWPGRLKPGKVTAPLHAVDWMPTLTHLAGYQPPRDLQWDGQDVWPVVTATARPAERTLYFPFVNGKWAIRQGNWKLLCEGTGKAPELYDLAADPNEERDLATDKPDVVAALQTRLTEAQKLDRKDRPPDPAGGAG
ncbi:MAG: hypothetical protein AUJ96_11790 [Armatimonadetes bacterium CG2_30_66_41]|nr:MAG: hypothetical protein AUJ96_11790 [Armatimonadetes bacterium CG2_30_66_41]